MTKHILTQDSITAAKALVSRLCENGHVRMSVPVNFERDEDMLICALIDAAEKSLAAPTSPASGALPADPQALHAAIMNLPCNPPEDANINQRLSFKAGHKEARHAAAELALAALASREASPAPLAEVPWDGCLNDLGWKMDKFLTGNGAKYDGRVFNNMKGFLRDCITEWLSAHPAALASPQVAPALTRQHIIEWLDGEDIEVTDKQMDRLFSGAVAPAPKPLDDPRVQQWVSDAVEGAMAFGFQGNNPPPAGHWLERFWNIGRAEAVNVAAPAPVAPTPAQPSMTNEEAVGSFAIEVEKMMCAKLGVPWTASGISIVSLIDRLYATLPSEPEGEATPPALKEQQS